jgi:heme exporter protein A
MPSHDGSALLEAHGLGRSFGRVRILQDISLSLHAGEALAIIGPNGAGKTTLLRLFAGLIRPTAGEIRLLGHPLRRGADSARGDLGLLAHHSMLYDDLTLLENLTFAARLHGLERPGERAASALESVGLGHRANDVPRRLSRGLLQRAAIARAVLHSPRVLLLDEPFTALDAFGVERLRTDLSSRMAGGLGLIVVTHHLAEAWDLATRVAVLIDGRLVADEPRAGLLETFLPRYHGMIGA